MGGKEVTTNSLYSDKPQNPLTDINFVLKFHSQEPVKNECSEYLFFIIT